MKNNKKIMSAISHNGDDAQMGPQTYEDWLAEQNGNSGKFDSGSLISAIGRNVDSLLGLFKKPDTNNTYYVTQSDESKKDNTMLYVGIGGVVLVVLLFLVIALKK